MSVSHNLVWLPLMMGRCTLVTVLLAQVMSRGTLEIMTIPPVRRQVTRSHVPVKMHRSTLSRVQNWVIICASVIPRTARVVINLTMKLQLRCLNQLGLAAVCMDAAVHVLEVF